MHSRSNDAISRPRRAAFRLGPAIWIAHGLLGFPVAGAMGADVSHLPVGVGTTAHDIPRDVTVQAFVRPDGRRLTFLVRVPLEAMRDIEFPTVGQGFLDIEAARPLLRDAAMLWLADYVSFFEAGRELDAPGLIAVRITLPFNRSFSTFDAAAAHVRAPPLTTETQIPWQQALMDVMFEYSIDSDASRFSIEPRFAHLGLRTLTVLRFIPPNRGERVFQYVGDPGLVQLDPSWFQASWRFVRLGFGHILDGLDHLLFLLCLVIPLRSLRAVVPVITSFTVAHSITLIASASGIAPGGLWFPPLIETLIAASIVYMALENIVGARPQRRWALAFGFGLVHGFGFSFVLRDTLQFAGSHLLTSLLSFNIGVELGQLFVVALTIPILTFVFRRMINEKVGAIILSAIIAHTGWHWMTERGAAFLEYDIAWTAIDAAALMRWAMLAVIVGGAAWLLRGPLGGWFERAADERASTAANTP